MAKARIMVVEDEIIVARDLARILAQLDYEVPALVTSGEEALERAAALRPDLVLMDIHLAGQMDGIAAAQAIRQQHEVPVVFLTAHSDEATFKRAEITEPYGYVLKPFEERELAIAVSVALYRHRVESRLAQMERWLSTTLHSIGDAVIATDLAGTLTFMNAHAEQLTGWSLSEARGMPLDEVLRLVREADHAPVQNLVERV
ncbi:MAG: response regulator, partial [Nevskiales bacterium]